MPDKVGLRWLIVLAASGLIVLAFAVAAGMRIGTWEICAFRSYPLCGEARLVAFLESCAVVLFAIGALIANERRPDG